MIYKPIEKDLKILEGQELFQIAVGPADLQLNFSNNVHISITETQIIVNGERMGLHEAAKKLFLEFMNKIQKINVSSLSNLEIYFSSGTSIILGLEFNGYESFTVSDPKGISVC